MSSPERITPWSPPHLSGRPGLRPAPPASAVDGAPALAPWSPPELAPGDGLAPSRARTPEDEAFALGHAEGLASGEARALERIAPALQALARIAEHMEASRARFEHDRERNLHGLAIAVAHQIVQRAVATDPTIVSDLVARALELMPASVPIEVRLCPDDLAALSDVLEQLSAAGRAIPIQWLPDPALAPGSFTMDSPVRIVDGRTDTALRMLFERLEHA